MKKLLSCFTVVALLVIAAGLSFSAVAAQGPDCEKTPQACEKDKGGGQDDGEGQGGGQDQGSGGNGSHSNPDGAGLDLPGGTQGDTHDQNNGSGNDPDHCDDNNGKGCESMPPDDDPPPGPPPECPAGTKLFNGICVRIVVDDNPPRRDTPRSQSTPAPDAPIVCDTTGCCVSCIDLQTAFMVALSQGFIDEAEAYRAQLVQYGCDIPTMDELTKLGVKAEPAETQDPGALKRLILGILNFLGIK
ncbi:MAG: hypothetical protein UX26_C0032G0004 [Parcubacteria group bacterium GW2011_GWC1_45_9]|nr:MAG: hypothetical protein UX26_C0032G0004 [Parcubacteria group bacterium GW2011_GWC1_45_9]HCI05350.1 hypothetical protein [Patescibacteria group bacterium]